MGGASVKSLKDQLDYLESHQDFCDDTISRKSNQRIQDFEDIFKASVRAKINTSFQITQFYQPLFFGCYYGLTEIVRNIVEQDPTLIHERDLDGFTPFYIACYKGYDDICRILISYGVNINLGKYPYSPLYVAALNGHQHIVSLLVSVHAQLDQMDLDEHLPYDIAATKEIRDMIQQAHVDHGLGLCVICWEHPIHQQYTISPCHHQILCRQCSHQMMNSRIRTCPYCRIPIESMLLSSLHSSSSSSWDNLGGGGVIGRGRGIVGGGREAAVGAMPMMLISPPTRTAW
jgi:hypothetical protein